MQLQKLFFHIVAHYVNIVCISLDTQESSYLMDYNISKQNAVDGPRHSIYTRTVSP